MADNSVELGAFFAAVEHVLGAAFDSVIRDDPRCIAVVTESVPLLVAKLQHLHIRAEEKRRGGAYVTYQGYAAIATEESPYGQAASGTEVPWGSTASFGFVPLPRPFEEGTGVLFTGTTIQWHPPGQDLSSSLLANPGGPQHMSTSSLTDTAGQWQLPQQDLSASLLASPAGPQYMSTASFPVSQDMSTSSLAGAAGSQNMFTANFAESQDVFTSSLASLEEPQDEPESSGDSLEESQDVAESSADSPERPPARTPRHPTILAKAPLVGSEIARVLFHDIMHHTQLTAALQEHSSIYRLAGSGPLTPITLASLTHLSQTIDSLAVLENDYRPLKRRVLADFHMSYVHICANQNQYMRQFNFPTNLAIGRRFMLQYMLLMTAFPNLLEGIKDATAAARECNHAVKKLKSWRRCGKAWATLSRRFGYGILLCMPPRLTDEEMRNARDDDVIRFGDIVSEGLPMFQDMLDAGNYLMRPPPPQILPPPPLQVLQPPPPQVYTWTTQ